MGVLVCDILLHMKRLVSLGLTIAVLGIFFMQPVHAQVADGTTTPDATIDSQGNPIIPSTTDATSTGTATNGATTSTDQIPADLSSYDSSTNASDIDANVNPPNPGSFTTITVTLDSNIVDLRRYMINWYVDGASVGGGIGKYTLLAKTKNYGQTTNIRATIALDTGIITKDVSLTPEDMTMMWEAVDAYVPPFYQGKKLPGRESIIKVVAIPNFISNNTTIDPSNAVYNWQRNGNVVENASGYGNDTLLIKQNMLNANEQVEATASDVTDNIQATGDITVPIFNPKVLFYSIDPMTGIKSSIAQSTINFNTPSTNIVAEPYNFSVLNNNPNSLSFTWTMNDNPITIADAKNQTLLDLQNPGTSGFATIGVSATNPRTQFQEAENSLSAIFNQ